MPSPFRDNIMGFVSHKLRNNFFRRFDKRLLFLLLVIILSIVYSYPEILFKRPQSIHNWRQIDGLSLTLNYYQDGMHFFRPQLHGLYSDGSTTGYVAPSEIPFLYYFVAALYKLFGYHEFIFRIVNLLIFFLGLFYLFRLADRILNNKLGAVVVTVLIFSSPVLVYYANNFLPNTAAWSFSIIGWYYFYRYYQNKAMRTFVKCVIFFGMAAAMKVTELTGPVFILLLIMADKLGMVKTGLNSDGRFSFKIMSILAVFVFIGSWVVYARYYNNLHGTGQFMTSTRPLWVMEKEDILLNLHKMRVLWFKDYFYPVTFYFMITGILLALFWRKRSHTILRYGILYMTFALIGFSILWFQSLGDHDYFYIGFYVLPAFVFINTFVIIQSFEFKRKYLVLINAVFLIFAVVNVLHAQKRHNFRYEQTWINDYKAMADLYNIKPWLNKKGITRNDTIIFYPGHYIRPLYLMDTKGWTIFPHADHNSNDLQRDSIQMLTYLNHGAAYFITNDIETAKGYKPFEPYMKELFAQYKSIYIFRIPPQLLNFNPADSTRQHHH